MKVISRDSLSFQSKTTSFSFFGPEGSNPWESGQVKGGTKSYQQPGLEIAELVGLSVAKSEATCLFVMLSQPDVLREFPALPSNRNRQVRNGPT